MSAPLTPISRARQLVLTPLTAQDYLVQIVLSLFTRVELGKVVLDGEEIEYVGEPEPWTAGLFWTQLAHDVALTLNLLTLQGLRTLLNHD